eukprot:GFYU01012583.1.p1 GENE.GFYU01012583.1~~GFYU01012583.1.p1  ORF type:complete len:498 (+),score=95.01 GFYU01012583.1:182-1495(+)
MNPNQPSTYMTHGQPGQPLLPNPVTSTTTNLPLPVVRPSDAMLSPGPSTTSARGDPVEQFLGRSVAARVRYSTDDIPADAKGLKMLAEAGSWKLALHVTQKCLGGQHKPDEILQFRLCRIICLLKLKSFQSAQTEFDNLGDLDANTYDYDRYPHMYQGRRGSMVPFTLRVLKAELPHHMGNTTESIDRFYQLYDVCSKKIGGGGGAAAATGTLINLDSNNTDAAASMMFQGGAAIEQEDPSVWVDRKQRVISSLVSLHMSAKDYILATRLLQLSLQEAPTDVSVLSTLGRVHLQFGDSQTADNYFDRAECLVEDAMTDETMLMNRGLSNVCRGQYATAADEFQAVISQNSDHISAAMNFAICCLYMCQLPRAIATLEGLIKSDPLNNVNETVLFNLCTLYDLASENTAEKKKTLEELVKRYGTDDIDTALLRSGNNA